MGVMLYLFGTLKGGQQNSVGIKKKSTNPLNILKHIKPY